MKHPTKNITRKVAVVGCKHTTKDLILGLEREGLPIDHCVTIDPPKGREQKVAGYLDLRPFLDEKGILYTIARKYNLKCSEDQETLLGLKLDMLLVMGWQRLIPDWWLTQLSIGAFGMHGSSRPLPHGRGRSPMNWALIQNKKIFYTYLFQYQPGVDNGPVVGVKKFDITPHDTCFTLHLKNTVSMVKLCTKYLPALLDGTVILTPQSQEGVSYFPKRNPEDGIIYWEDSTEAIHNLIRAVTKPFSGAFSYLDDNPNQRVFLWRAIPFDTHLTWEDAKPGEIVEVFFDGTFVVQTGDSSLLVLESEGVTLTSKDVGRRFGHLGQPRKVWENLPP